MESAFHPILDIVMGRRDHPVIKDLVGEIGDDKKRPSTRDISYFYLDFCGELDILQGDLSLVEAYLRDMMLYVQDEERSGTKTAERIERDSLIYGPAYVLFTVVVVRTYLGHGPEDDDEIYRLISDAFYDIKNIKAERIKAEKRRKEEMPGPTESGEEEVFADDRLILPRYRLVRQLTTPEQAVAARLKRTRTDIDIDAEANMRFKVHAIDSIIDHDPDFALPPGEPRVIVWSREDMPAHVWPNSTSRGLTGGPIYVPYSVAQAQHRENRQPPKPRPLKRDQPHTEDNDAGAEQQPKSRKKRKVSRS